MLTSGILIAVFSEAGLFTETRACQFGQSSYPACPRECPISAGPGYTNPGPPACMVNTLPTELSSSSLCLLDIKDRLCRYWTASESFASQKACILQSSTSKTQSTQDLVQTNVCLKCIWGDLRSSIPKLSLVMEHEYNKKIEASWGPKSLISCLTILEFWFLPPLQKMLLLSVPIGYQRSSARVHYHHLFLGQSPFPPADCLGYTGLYLQTKNLPP